MAREAVRSPGSGSGVVWLVFLSLRGVRAECRQWSFVWCVEECGSVSEGWLFAFIVFYGAV